jgi:hypothetical protein
VLVDVAVDGEDRGAGARQVAGEECGQGGLAAAALADERDPHGRSTFLKMDVM